MKMYIGSLVPSRKHQITVRFTCQSRTVGPLVRNLHYVIHLVP